MGYAGMLHGRAHSVQKAGGSTAPTVGMANTMGFAVGESPENPQQGNLK